MPAADQSPLTCDHRRITSLKSGRRPLHPRNLPNTSSAINVKPKLKPVEWIADGSDKENVDCLFTPHQPKKETLPMESLDSSLADELMAIREKLERQRIDRERTERALKERSLTLDFQMKEILERGELQKSLEMEVDRLYRLKEIKLTCLRVAPLRSLRDKEEEKKMKEDELKSNVTRMKEDIVLQGATSDANEIHEAVM